MSDVALNELNLSIKPDNDSHFFVVTIKKIDVSFDGSHYKNLTDISFYMPSIASLYEMSIVRGDDDYSFTLHNGEESISLDLSHPFFYRLNVKVYSTFRDNRRQTSVVSFNKARAHAYTKDYFDSLGVKNFYRPDNKKAFTPLVTREPTGSVGSPAPAPVYTPTPEKEPAPYVHVAIDPDKGMHSTADINAWMQSMGIKGEISPVTEKKALLLLIDEALDNNDKEEFEKLTKSLASLPGA